MPNKYVVTITETVVGKRLTERKWVKMRDFDSSIPPENQNVYGWSDQVEEIGENTEEVFKITLQADSADPVIKAILGTLR